MRKIIFSCLSLMLLISVSSVSAQSIDAGRGELPLTVPASYSGSNPAPLIVLLHGYGSSGAGQDSYMKFSDLANHYGFLFIAPDGQQETEGQQSRFWNASDACCNFQGSPENDVAYVMSIINNVKSEYNVDSNRVYLIGHSNGGFMSYRTAYENSASIAAIASLAGAEATVAGPAPANPVHILQIHGTADTTIAYAGDEIQGNNYPGAVETVERWAAYNGCSLEGSEVAQLDLESQFPGYDSTVVRYNSGCKVGGSSELWTITDGSHVPAISDSFSANVVGWLMAHPKVGSSSANAAD
jgi:polyhydroxybutyrate depolymerase